MGWEREGSFDKISQEIRALILLCNLLLPLAQDERCGKEPCLCLPYSGAVGGPTQTPGVTERSLRDVLIYTFFPMPPCGLWAAQNSQRSVSHNWKPQLGLCCCAGAGSLSPRMAISDRAKRRDMTAPALCPLSQTLQLGALRV